MEPGADSNILNPLGLIPFQWRNAKYFGQSILYSQIFIDEANQNSDLSLRILASKMNFQTSVNVTGASVLDSRSKIFSQNAVLIDERDWAPASGSTYSSVGVQFPFSVTSGLGYADSNELDVIRCIEGAYSAAGFNLSSGIWSQSGNALGLTSFGGFNCISPTESVNKSSSNNFVFNKSLSSADTSTSYVKIQSGVSKSGIFVGNETSFYIPPGSGFGAVSGSIMKYFTYNSNLRLCFNLTNNWCWKSNDGQGYTQNNPLQEGGCIYGEFLKGFATSDSSGPFDVYAKNNNEKTWKKVSSGASNYMNHGWWYSGLNVVSYVVTRGSVDQGVRNRSLSYFHYAKTAADCPVGSSVVYGD